MLKLISQNLKSSARMLWKSPGFAVVAIVTLALGIGANVTIFSFINALVLRPIAGVERPDRLAGVYTSDYSSGPYGGSSYPDYLDFKQQATAFSDLAAYDGDLFIWSGVDNPERLQAGLVTTNYFQVLGVGAELGRTLRAEDEEAGAPLTVVLSDSLWKRRFGGNASALGQTMNLNNKVYTIVGVTNENFRGLQLGSNPEIWTAMSSKFKESGRGNRGIGITGRLRDGVSVEQAQAEITTIADRLAHAYPETNMGTLAQPNSPRPMTVVTEARLDPSSSGGIRTVTMLLFIVVALVLLIACANVANLVLARSAARRHELAIRLALGASRFRLIQHLLSESLFLALIGGVAGLLLSFWLARLIPALFWPGESGVLDVTVDFRVLAFTFLVSSLTGILFGLIPAIHASRPELVSTLKDDPSGVAFSLRRFGLRNVLVTGQVALSVLLLIVAGLFLRSLKNAVTLNPGFDNRNLLLATLNVGRGLAKPQLQTFFQELTNNISAQSGVRSATLTKVVPLSGGGERRGIKIEGYQPQPNEDTELNTNVVGSNYFSTMGIPFLKGRDFNSGDRDGVPGVVIVNREFSQRYFPGGTAVGKRIRTDSEKPFIEIVGEVGTVKHRNLREPSLPIVYIPLAQEMQGNMTLIVSTSVDPSTLRANVISAVHNLDRNIPVQVKTISDQINQAIAPDQSMAVLLGVFGAVALLLASVGIYGVVSYAVTRRTHEIGIRMALGARSTDVLRLVVREGMLMAIAGVILGLLAAFALTRLIGSLLFGLTPTDPLTFVMVTLGLLFIALVACFIPASRATRVDPLEALRYE